MPVRTVILCGGMGLRMAGHPAALPKPLIPVGPFPLVRHVMNHYARHGGREFILALGYAQNKVRQYLEYAQREEPDLIQVVDSFEPYRVDLGTMNVLPLDTGEATDTGGRLFRCRDHLSNSTFALTYADGLSNVDLNAVYEFHRSHGLLVTLVAVKPETTFGVLDIDTSGVVVGFREKPQLDVWINGGFFLCEPRVFDYLTESCNFEKDVLPQISADGQLAAFRFTGFWACADTPKDAMALDAAYRNGQGAWCF